MQKQRLAEWFSFSKKGRNGTLVLLAIILLLILIPFLFPLFIKPKKYDHHTFEKEIATIQTKPADSMPGYRKRLVDDDNDTYKTYDQPRSNTFPKEEERQTTLFYFDPNTLDETGWQKLGLRDKTIATIKNYLSKGGKFYKPEDIKKIWGIKEELANELVPYVRIEKIENAAAAKPAYEKKTYTPPVVDINTADTTAFIALPGIGSKLAQRIIAFRDKLGGFYAIDQVGETYGLADSTFQKIKTRLEIHNKQVKALNINTATLDELKSHPYLRYTIANAIVQYRAQHGNFSSLQDIKKVVLVTTEVYDKILPYLQL